MSSTSSSVPGLLHAAGDYFATPDGKPVYLAGSHTWTDQQDIGATFDNAAFLNLLTSDSMNFTRLWAWEAATDGGVVYGSVSPLPYAKSGAKYDLSQFNQAYFDRMRARVQAAGERGIYSSIMLFDGWSVQPNGSNNNPWTTNPFNAANNINGINGDPSNTGLGADTQRLVPSMSSILTLQEAYVAKVIDTVGDLSNVLFEVSNETNGDNNTWNWQNAIADYIHQYETSRGGLQHPVGMTGAGAPIYSDVSMNAILNSSHADWISPLGTTTYQSNPPAATGNKVSIVDTDHVFGLGGDGGWAWQMFTRGHNVLYMDDLSGTGVSGTLTINLSSGQVAQEKSARLGIAETRQVATLLDLTGMKPSGDLSSTGYALADPASGEYVVYSAGGGTFTADLSGAAGKALDARWMDIGSGRLSASTTVQGGSDHQAFSSPYGSSASAVVLTPQASSTPTPAPTAGPDTVVVNASASLALGVGAHFNLIADGTVVGSATVSSASIQAYSFNTTLLGGSAAAHDIQVQFDNDYYGGGQDRNLYLQSIAVDGQTTPATSNTEVYHALGVASAGFGPGDIAGSGTMLWQGTAEFKLPAANTPPAPASDTLTLHLSENAWRGDAQFIASLDGHPLGAAQSVSAAHAAGRVQDFTYTGAFGIGQHDLAVTFLNDASGRTPSMDRNLYVNGVDYNGAPVPQATAALYTNGTVHFQVSAAPSSL